MVPSVIASFVCWSLQCLVYALTQRGRWRTLFFFIISFQKVPAPLESQAGLRKGTAQAALTFVSIVSISSDL